MKDSDGNVYDVDETSLTKSVWLEYSSATGVLTLNANPSVNHFGSTEFILSVGLSDVPEFEYS